MDYRPPGRHRLNAGISLYVDRIKLDLAPDVDEQIISAHLALEGETPEVETHPYDPETEARQIAALNKVRDDRDNQKLSGLLDRLKTVAGDDSQNIMPITIELVKASASMGEIVEALKGVWGTYRETPVI